MTRYVLLEGGEVVDQFSTPGRERPVPERDNPRGLKMMRVKRFGRRGERLDARGNWVTDAPEAERAIDAAHHADHGAFALALEHGLKAIEARLLLGTLATDGLVAREAQATGRDPMALAAEIAARAPDGRFEKAMIARRRGKTELRETKHAG